jgi:photosystem II stability/assembly factor-like uncharacterized protein
MKTSHHGSFAVAALCAFVVACGGGGGDSPPPPPPPTVLPASVAIANDARADAGTATTFHTDVATATGLSFRWDFGDGSTGNGPTASHAYAKPGTYTVTLAVANAAEDLRTATSTIQVGAYANVNGLSCSQGDSAGWCWQHAIVTGHQINDVFFVDASHAWAVGDDLTILKSADAGTTWTAVAVDSTIAPVSLRSVRFYDAAHGMVLDNQGGALQTADGGATWKTVPLGASIYVGPKTFVAYGPNRIVLQAPYYSSNALSTDGGSTWSTIGMTGPMQVTSNDCWSFTYYAVLRDAGCGATPTTSLSPSISNGSISFATGAVTGDSQALVIASGYSYTDGLQQTLGWSTADGGATWTAITPTGLPLYMSYYGLTLAMTDAQSGLLYSPTTLSAYATSDGGLDWVTVTPSAAVTQGSAYYQAAGLVGNVFWQSAGNRVSLSTDRGQTWHDATVHAEDGTPPWTLQSATVTQYIDANNFVVAIASRFYITADGGQTFRQLFGPDSRDAGAQFAAGEFTDIRHGMFLTSNGALLSTADGGRSWTRQDYPPSGAGPVALHFTSATEGWLVLNGKLAHSTDGGTTWSTPLTNAAMTNIYGMSWGDATHAWAWNYNQLFYTLDAGATWTLATLPANVNVNSATMTGPLTGVVASSYGNGGATTQDGGVTWQPITTNLSIGNLVHTHGQTVWSFAPYSMARSNDGGRTWQAAGPAPSSVTYTGISFADDLHGWLIGTNGAVVRTIDGGATWAAQPVGSDITPLGVVAVDSMTAWIITSNGQVLATATAGN